MVEVNGSGNTLTYYGTATNTGVNLLTVQALVCFTFSLTAVRRKSVGCEGKALI
jgi:hypothetical protein